MRLQQLLPFFFLLFANSVQASAQSKIDSLLARVKTTPPGQEKIDLYEKLSLRYMDVEVQDFVRARSYTDSIKLLSEKIDSRKGHFQALYGYGVLAYRQGDYDQAQVDLQAVVQYSKAQGDSVRMREGLFHMAVVDMNLGNYEKSLATLYGLLKNVEEGKDAGKVGMILNSIGTVHDRTNKFNEAVDAYIRAGEMFIKAKLPVRYGMTLQNRANIYLAQKKNVEAGKAYQEALRIFEEAKLPVFVAIVLGNLGRWHVAQNQYDLALSHNQRALMIWRQHNRKHSLANCLINLGITSVKLKQYAQASTYLNEALSIGKEIKVDLLMYEVYSAIQALHLAQNDFKQAYDFYSLANEMKDSLFTESRIKEVNELQAKYETEKKDKQIVLLAKEKETQTLEAQRQATLKKAFIGALVLVTIIALLIIFLLRQKMINNKILSVKNQEIKESNLKREISELEMKALRAQINPHFIFNSMNSINTMILAGDADGASHYLAKFSKLIRLILENSENNSVSLGNELAMLESYIQLENLRFKGRINYRIEVSETIDKENTNLPSMVLQPFVENAIWHGLMHKQSDLKGLINIAIGEEDDMLLCTIEDNGVGRDRAGSLEERSILKTKSMGVQITENRLKLLNGNRSTKLIHIIDLKDRHDNALGTRVDIRIPLN
jgi:tetratricopeptide (TPR) repeat protein